MKKAMFVQFLDVRTIRRRIYIFRALWLSRRVFMTRFHRFPVHKEGLKMCTSFAKTLALWDRRRLVVSALVLREKATSNFLVPSLYATSLVGRPDADEFGDKVPLAWTRATLGPIAW
jgi:hypothetical protein